MGCVCSYNVFCRVHPKCPWCGNYTTVFASVSANEFSCTRCHKLFTSKTIVNRIPATPVSKDKNIMAKTIKNVKLSGKSAKSSKSTKSSKKVERATRESNLAYEFVKMPKDAPSEDTNIGCVLAGIRKIKDGSLDEVTAAALKCGFETDQDAATQARIFLRQLHNRGAVRISRNGVEASNGKQTAKGKKGSKKSFKLVKK